MSLNMGYFFCIASAIAYGAIGIFGKLAYDDGVTVGTLLCVRFGFAAIIFWILVAARGLQRSLTRRVFTAGLALGFIGLASQAAAYFAALSYLDAGLLALLSYTFPPIIAVASVALGRERWSNRNAAALALALGGLALVVLGAGTGTLNGLGVVLGVGSAVIYATYVLFATSVADQTHPMLLGAAVSTGAALSVTIGSSALGELQPGAVGVVGWASLVCMAAVSTVLAIGLFFAGLPRIGATRASILATAEPVTAVVLSFVVFGNELTGTQCLGGLLVVGAVLTLTMSRTSVLREGGHRAEGAVGRGTWKGEPANTVHDHDRGDEVCGR